MFFNSDRFSMTKGHVAGFTLIEVLIAVFVLTLGVIGAAGMQLTALRTTQQSGLQTSALELAAEMADKMRANSRQMKGPDSPYVNLNFQSADEPGSAAPGASCYGASANCSAEDLAAFDIYDWKRRVRASLPGGRAMICRDAAPWGAGAGALTWNCGSDAGNGPLVIKLGWQAKNPDGSLIRDGAGQFPPAVALLVEAETK
jgi:type IV pilus assembly protein PilV